MLALAAPVLLLACSAGGSGLRGVAPGDEARYQPSEKFACFDGKKAVAWEKLNDDYCDCADGSDEPGTAACSDLTPRAGFYCRNAGHHAERILQSRVDDGICDCCDGTDELGTSADCRDICEEVATVWAKEKEEHDKKIREGLARKAELVAQAKVIVATKTAEKARKAAESETLAKGVVAAEEEERVQNALEQAERDVIKAESEKKKAEHDAEVERTKVSSISAQKALHKQRMASIAAHGTFTKGGKVALLRDLSFSNDQKHPAGTRGTVLSVSEDPDGLTVIVSIDDDVSVTFKAGDLDIHPIEPQPAAGTPSERSADAPPSPCVSWTQTANCDPEGKEESTQSCSEVIFGGRSGFCLCTDGKRHGFKCTHKPLTCQTVCESDGAKEAKTLKDFCPPTFPHPSVPGTDFELNVCYKTKDEAAAGSGACGSWCARDTTWFAANKCKWGCECGELCSADDADFSLVNVLDPNENTFAVDDGAGHVRDEAKQARDNVFNLRSRLNALKSEIEALEKELTGNYGPENEFLPLKGQCFELKTPDYVYKLCPFSEVKQGTTSMGKWGSWAQQTYGSWGGQDDLTTQKYDNGQHCWSGPHRSTEVKVVCGVDNLIRSMNEPSMCTYTLVWETPAACANVEV